MIQSIGMEGAGNDVVVGGRGYGAGEGRTQAGPYAVGREKEKEGAQVVACVRVRGGVDLDQAGRLMAVPGRPVSAGAAVGIGAVLPAPSRAGEVVCATRGRPTCGLSAPGPKRTARGPQAG